MKKKTILLAGFATLALFATITGCRKSDDWFYGNVSFWNVDVNEDIDVTVDGRSTRTITDDVNPSYCNHFSTANFYLQEGYHTYHAESIATGVTWNGDFYVETDCKLIKLFR